MPLLAIKMTCTLDQAVFIAQTLAFTKLAQQLTMYAG